MLHPFTQEDTPEKEKELRSSHPVLVETLRTGAGIKPELTLTLPTFVQSLAQQVCLLSLGEGFLEEKNRISHKSTLNRIILFSSHLHLRQSAAL